MINYLKDIKKQTLIGQLPDIINSNNESIRNEFNWIFDSSLNRLTKSVYAPTGSVKAHFGEFVNLACEYITIKNPESLKETIQSNVESIIRESFDPSTQELTNHNLLNNRFKHSEFEEDEQCDFMHDAMAIVYKKDGNNYITIEDKLNSYEENISQINTLSSSVNSMQSSLNDGLRTLSAISSNVETLNSLTSTYGEQIKTLNNSDDVTVKNYCFNVKPISSEDYLIIKEIEKNICNICNLDPNVTEIRQLNGIFVDFTDRLDEDLSHYRNQMDEFVIILQGSDEVIIDGEITFMFTYADQKFVAYWEDMTPLRINDHNKDHIFEMHIKTFLAKDADESERLTEHVILLINYKEYAPI